MNVLLSGPVEGYLARLLVQATAKDAQWIVCAGDFGVWPDPARMDRSARMHASAEFSRRYVGVDTRPIDIPVVTIAGVHDDNRWLTQRQSTGNTEILSNVHWLSQGYKTVIGMHGPPCRVTGLGRAYSEATYAGEFSRRSSRHYTRHDVERACSSGPTDLFVAYEHLDAPGIRNAIYATRPKLIVSCGHPNRKTYDEIQGTPVITLDRGETKLVVWEDGQFVFSNVD